MSYLQDGMMEPKIAIQCHYQLVLHQIKKLFLVALILYNSSLFNNVMTFDGLTVSKRKLILTQKHTIQHIGVNLLI